MLSDLTKWEKPLYDDGTLALLMVDAALFCKSKDEMRYWINGFN